MNNRESVLESINFRYACKEFNGQRIPKEDLDVLLETGRLAPSAFGLEHTRLIVVQSNEIKEKMKPLCHHQKQITTASEVVVFVSLIGDLRSPSPYIDRMVRRKTGKDERAYQMYKEMVDETISSFDDKALAAWSFRQSYLMAQAMMDSAARLKIDSCAIEGFDKDPLEKFFQLDPKKEQIAILIPFGYRKGEQPPKIRLERDELIKFM